MWVRHEDSVIFGSATRILYYVGPPRGFCTNWVRQRDSVSFWSADAILYYLGPPKGLSTIWVRHEDSVRQEDSVLFRSARFHNILADALCRAPKPTNTFPTIGFRLVPFGSAYLFCNFVFF